MDVVEVVDAIAGRALSLLRVPSVVAYERPLLDHLSASVGELLPGRMVQRAPNRVVVPGRPDLPVLSAHVDRHGLVCTGRNAFTYAAHAVPSMRGAPPTPRHSFARTVCTRFDDEPVRAYDPASGATIGEGLVAHASVCQVEDLGVTVPVRGLEDVKLAVPVAFAAPGRWADGRLSGQLDNALTAAMGLEALVRGYAGTVVFTAEEEVGNSWQYLQEALVEHGLLGAPLLVLDTSPFDDSTQANRGTVVLRHRDANATFDPDLVERLAVACAGIGAPSLFKDDLVVAINQQRLADGLPPRGLGITELGRLLAATEGAVRGATLQVPTFGYHTNAETTTATAIGAVASVLFAVIGL